MVNDVDLGNGRVRLALATPLFICAAALVGFVVYSHYIRFDFPLDDSWIHQVYARSFAYGQGFAYNTGEQEAGSTSPLWAITTAPVHWVAAWAGPESVAIGVKLIGAFLAGLAVLLVAIVGLQITGSAWAAAIGATVLATDSRLPFSAFSGMETCPLLVLWLGALWAGLRGRPRLTLALLGLSPLVRPEAAVVVCVAVPALLFVSWPSSKQPPWRDPVAVALLTVPSACWALFCKLVSGSWLPNTFHVKARPFELDGATLEVAWNELTRFGWGGRLALAAGLCALVWWFARRRQRADVWPVALLLVAPLAYAIGVAGSRVVAGNGAYYWSRWCDPAGLVLVAAGGLGLGLLVASSERLLDGALARRAAGTLGVIALLSALPGVAGSYVERRHRLATDSRAIRKMNVEPAQWIAKNTPDDAVVGVDDAGAFRFFGQRRTADLGGLNNGDLIHGRLSPKELWAAVDWIAVFPAIYGPPGLLEPFEAMKLYELPREEYTVCDCPRQTTVFVGRRRHLPANARRAASSQR